MMRRKCVAVCLALFGLGMGGRGASETFAANLEERMIKLEEAARMKDVEIAALKDEVKALKDAVAFQEKTDVVKQVTEYVCKKGHIFDAAPDQKRCPICGDGVKKRVSFRKFKVARRESVAEKIEAALEDEEKRKVVVGLSATGVGQQILASEAGDKANFAEGSVDLVLAATPLPYTTLFVDFEAVGGNGPDEEIGSQAGLNDDAGSLQDEDGVDRVSVREAWISSRWWILALELIAGKIDLTNYFDSNLVANDETSQFLTSALVNNPVLGNPDNGPGVVLYYDTKKGWRFGAGVQSVDNSGSHILDEVYAIAEVDYNTRWLFGREGNYRLWGRVDGGQEEEPVAFGLNFDQKATDTVTLFARYGLAEETDEGVEYAWSVGLEKAALLDFRARDRAGAAFSMQEGPDGKDNIAEIYYRIFLGDHFHITPNAQWLFQTAGTPDEGQPSQDDVFLLGVRAQADF